MKIVTSAVLYTVMALTQTLTGFGMFAGINMMVWGYGLPLIGLFDGIENILLLIGYNITHTDFNDDAKAGAEAMHLKVSD